MNSVIVVIGAGSIGQAVARRVSAGKQVLLADLRQGNVDAAAKVLSDAGFEVSTAIVDISSRESLQALVLELFGVVIASQSGHRLAALAPEQDRALAITPTEELLALPTLQTDQIKDTLHAYQISKRGNSLRVMAEAVRRGKRGARVNTISPGIIIAPPANDETNTDPKYSWRQQGIKKSRRLVGERQHLASHQS